MCCVFSRGVSRGGVAVFCIVSLYYECFLYYRAGCFREAESCSIFAWGDCWEMSELDGNNFLVMLPESASLLGTEGYEIVIRTKKRFWTAKPLGYFMKLLRRKVRHQIKTESNNDLQSFTTISENNKHEAKSARRNLLHKMRQKNNLNPTPFLIRKLWLELVLFGSALPWDCYCCVCTKVFWRKIHSHIQSLATCGTDLNGIFPSFR